MNIEDKEIADKKEDRGKKEKYIQKLNESTLRKERKGTKNCDITESCEVI